MSQRELARLSGVNPGIICRLEGGTTFMGNRVFALATALQVSAGWLDPATVAQGSAGSNGMPDTDRPADPRKPLRVEEVEANPREDLAVEYQMLIDQAEQRPSRSALSELLATRRAERAEARELEAVRRANMAEARVSIAEEKIRQAEARLEMLERLLRNRE